MAIHITDDPAADELLTTNPFALLGAEPKPVRAYNSCGLWLQPVERLGDQAETLAAEGGFGAVKLRLGRDDPLEDLAAVRAVTKRVGGRLRVMADFNQRLSLSEAVRIGDLLDDEGLYWIEEPMRHDRYGDYAQSYPNTVPYSEGIGFIAHVRDADLDYPYFVTAHEVAHQWWGHQVLGAAVQGESMLSESLAEYSALMVMERRYGRERIGRFDARTIGLAWRHSITPELGLEALYAHQDRSGDAASDAWSLRVLHRW